MGTAQGTLVFRDEGEAIFPLRRWVACNSEILSPASWDKWTTFFHPFPISCKNQLQQPNLILAVSLSIFQLKECVPCDEIMKMSLEEKRTKVQNTCSSGSHKLKRGRKNTMIPEFKTMAVSIIEHYFSCLQLNESDHAIKGVSILSSIQAMAGQIKMPQSGYDAKVHSNRR